jgi:hypothetical protein
MLFILCLAPWAKAQVAFEDDFAKDLSKWKVLVEDKVNGTKWQVRNGFLDSGNGDNNPQPLAITAGNQSWVNYTMESDATVTDASQGTGYLQLMGRMKDVDNWYAFRYSTGDPASLATEGLGGLKKANPEVWLVKRAGGKYKQLAASTKAVPNTSSGGAELKGKFIKFKLEINNTSLKGSIDSGKGYELFVEASDSELKSGAIGLGQQEYAASFDNVKVTLVGPQVSVEAKGKLATSWGDVKRKY